MKPIARVIDISHHNWEDMGGNLDFEAAARSGIWGVIHKATEHTTYVDPFYFHARAECKRLGLLFGAYHFFRPEPVEWQVEHFLQTAMPSPDMLLVLDHEDENCTLEMARHFMVLVEERTGQRPAIYSGHLLKEQIGSNPDPYFSGSRLWLAQYGDDPDWPPQWQEMWLWQFTDGNVGPEPHFVPGIGTCDINSFAGSNEELEATWAQEAPAMPDDKPEPPKPVLPGERVPPWLHVMRAITGLTEGPGSADNPKILGMRDYIARKWPDMAEYCSYYKHDDTPWCGLCCAFCVSVANIRPPFGATDTDKWMWALSWSDPKDAKGFVPLTEPQQGCIVITEREGGGHVTMYEYIENGKYMCRGGNQSDMVNVTAIDPSTVVGLMWPTEHVPEVGVPVDQFNAWMQASLNILGTTPPLEVDGEYGPKTEDAIKEFQKRHDLTQTGVGDKETVDALLEELEAMNDERKEKP